MICYDEILEAKHTFCDVCRDTCKNRLVASERLPEALATPIWQRERIRAEWILEEQQDQSARRHHDGVIVKHLCKDCRAAKQEEELAAEAWL